MKRTLAALVTAILLAGALLLGNRDRRASTAPAATPEDCIQQMFEAARLGDIDAYLNCFTGPQRKQIERRLADQPRETFAQSLIDAVQDLKGRAIAQTSEQREGANRVELSVDRVYENGYERQSYQLVREAGAWRIDEVAPAVPYQPDIPYGAPVFEPPPESDDQLNQTPPQEKPES